MFTRALRASLVVGFFLASFPGSSRADNAETIMLDMASQLDGDAPLVIVYRPGAESAIWQWLRGFGGPLQPLMAQVLASISEENTKNLGFDPTSQDGWNATGIDPSAPVMASVLAIDQPQADKTFWALMALKPSDDRSLSKAPRAFWRNRLVALATDPQKVRTLLQKTAQETGGLFAVVNQADDKALAHVLGADARPMGTVRVSLQKQKVTDVFRFREEGGRADSFLFVKEGRLITFDWLISYAGLPISWSRDGKEILRILARKPAKGGMSPIFHQGAGKLLVTSQVAAWLEPGRVLHTFVALERENLPRIAADLDAAEGAEVRGRAERVKEACDQLRPIVTEGLFKDVVFTFRSSSSALEMGIAWGMRSPLIGAALATSDDGLLDPAISDTLASGALYLGGYAPLRALPRPKILSKGTDPFETAVEDCGYGAAMVPVLMGWPHLLGLGLETLASKEPSFKNALDHARNIAAAVYDIDMSKEDIEGLIMASFPDTFAAVMDPELAATHATPPISRKTKGRTVQAWSSKQDQEHVIVKSPLEGGRLAYGKVEGGLEVIDWFFGRPQGNAPRTPASAIGLFKIDLPRILRKVSKQEPMSAPYLEEAAKHLGPITGKLATSGDVLAGSIRLEIK